jgi:cysteine desulfurase family protein (TIGR01976 family)
MAALGFDTQVECPCGWESTMTTFDIHWVRAQFPALQVEVDSTPGVFFDAPGGTQVPQRVIDAMREYLINSNSNTHGAFITSRRSDDTIASAHSAVADLLGCAADEVVFGPNMTTLTFAISRAIGREIQPGDEFVVTHLDHNANIAPWVALEERGAVVRYVDIHPEDCTLDMDGLKRHINERTRLVALGYAANAVGTINDVAEAVRLAHGAGALTYIDAVHYAPHGAIDVRALDCDFLACSSYKFFGPHCGVLFGKREHLERLSPYKVRPASEKIPDRWETGTQNHEGQAGVVAAIDYLAELGRRTSPQAADRRQQLLAAYDAIHAYERGLSEHLIRGLLAIPGLTFYGIREPERFDHRTPTVGIRMPGRTPRQLAEYLGKRGIFTWDGNYYAINLTERLGVESSGGMLRIGLAHYNTAEEIDRLLAALRGLKP